MSISNTVVINTAGVGSRLGFGYPKSLLEIGGKPLIVHHLNNLMDCDDVRIVVGFQAQKIIDIVLPIRPDAIFVFNHQYQETNTLHSLALGSKFASQYVISLDGDLLIRPKDIRKVIQYPGEVVCYTPSHTQEPVFAKIEKKKNQDMITAFTRRKVLPNEWTGVVKIHSKKLGQNYGKEHVYQALKKYLPINAFPISCVEIDTPQDYENALRWAAEKLGVV